MISKAVVIDVKPVSGLFSMSSLLLFSSSFGSFSTFLPITLISIVPFTFEPSVAVAVIVAVPSFIALTIPSWSTVATLVSLLDQVNTLFVASFGLTVASNIRNPPAITSFLPSIVIFSTKTFDGAVEITLNVFVATASL